MTLRYDNGKPVGATAIVVSTQHSTKICRQDEVRDDRRALCPQGAARRLDQRQGPVWHVNPTGKFVIGGPTATTGLTGRKIIVDTYGGAAPHGGGAFSGKDPTKVDRSAAYAARYLAKNVVAAGSGRPGAPSSSPTPSASPSRCRSMSTRTAPARSTEDKLETALRAADAICRRAASASICSSTGRSMPAPRPMAISAARPTPRAASPGRRPISSTRSARSRLSDAFGATGAPDRSRHDAPPIRRVRRASIGPPQGQEAHARHDALLLDRAAARGARPFAADRRAPALFPRAALWLEIGFGGGEHLAAKRAGRAAGLSSAARPFKTASPRRST